MIETLVPPKGQYNHQKGCGTVAKVMQEKFGNSFALGIIDKDKRDIDYLKMFDIVCNKGSLIMHKHKTLHHYMIQISPAVEQFMLNCANLTGLSLSDYQLPQDLSGLRKSTKSTTSKNDVRFKNLFKALLANDSEDLKRLQRWVVYLKTNVYEVSLGDLDLL
ncbi:hypothetical protein IDJ77_00130 [Mucilaginibacter sp. ZT4R22]|uniref:Uncharacterized protein n=1 Tax=Mucilaginibacter pankratovii TaxID=2772110 RepID=A0ABR7WIP1_9SPHI|nr:hypothetical protein [Mucilaginibacter pankratovii]MBD1362200.1 hypothetical protein [Mucilaginibacter pankratovii]